MMSLTLEEVIIVGLRGTRHRKKDGPVCQWQLSTVVVSPPGGSWAIYGHGHALSAPNERMPGTRILD
jgi:hypothetical protein